MKMNTRYPVLSVCLAAAMAVAVSCEEFQPVFTGRYDDPEPVQTRLWSARINCRGKM